MFKHSYFLEFIKIVIVFKEALYAELKNLPYVQLRKTTKVSNYFWPKSKKIPEVFEYTSSFGNFYLESKKIEKLFSKVKRWRLISKKENKQFL